MITFLKIAISCTLVLLIVLIFHVYRYRNPYKLIMCFGKKGAGKTTLITKLSIRYNKLGRPVYSTVPIPGCYLFDPQRLGLDAIPRDAVIMIDEVGMIWDNRKFAGFKDHTRDYFKLQRHYGHTVYLFSQSFDIDKKLRDLTDQMFLIKNFCNCFSVSRRILRTITVIRAEEGGVGESKIVDDLKLDSIFFFWCGSVKFTYIPRYAKYFDSFEVPELKEVSYQYIPFPELPSLRQRIAAGARKLPAALSGPGAWRRAGQGRRKRLEKNNGRH